MAAHCLLCLSLFKYISLLLLVICLHATEDSDCPSIIHKKVGDTVNLPSCLPSEGVTVAGWKYGNKDVADKMMVNPHSQFRGRVNMSSTNFSLTVENLTLQDSGNFSFLSETEMDGQRHTTEITLQVHEAITVEPTLNVSSTWNILNSSCDVLLECNVASYSQVTYSWTMANNQSHSGSRMQFTLTPQEGDVGVTCTISNIVSNKSASRSVKCSNSTSPSPQEQGQDQPDFVTFVSVAAGVCLLILLLVVLAVGVNTCKQRQTAARDLNDLTVYADICEATTENVSSNTLTNPSSLYATIDDTRLTSAAPVLTVYDKIQLSRLMKTPASPHQDIYQGAQQKM